MIAEKIKLAVPVLPGIDPEDHIAEWVADHVHGLLPDPCEEAAGHAKAAEDTAAVIEDPASLLPRTARELVPRAAGRALGLISEE
ncbi:hypothetical protein AN216_06800 [Streptomyces oceani]|uniref:Uncharacterized protein n=1 Tax=Streptomyces oceani TaxID=1075402 RepID=A0A1E7KKR5_9ACTN|nr:hypothetical protein AN216_06800 [Streptomyces oceani]